MSKNRRLVLSMIAMLSLALGSWAILSAGDSTTAPSRAADANATEWSSSPETTDLFTPAAGGGSTKCCDPSQEPGVGGNPLCFEGHTCCSDGVWRCNNADATPSCDPGTECGVCGLSGAPCTSPADCCSGRCKGSGTCR
jgi:hypothetical protein